MENPEERAQSVFDRHAPRKKRAAKFGGFFEMSEKWHAMPSQPLLQMTELQPSHDLDKDDENADT